MKTFWKYLFFCNLHEAESPVESTNQESNLCCLYKVAVDTVAILDTAFKISVPEILNLN